MIYDTWSDAELKQHFFEVAARQHGNDWLLGWLKSSYLNSYDAAGERRIVILALHEFDCAASAA